MKNAQKNFIGYSNTLNQWLGVFTLKMEPSLLEISVQYIQIMAEPITDFSGEAVKPNERKHTF